MQRSVFMNEVKTQKFWIFQLGTQQGINIPIWIFIGFQQKDWHNSQKLHDDTFHRPPVRSVRNIIRTEKSPDSVVLKNFDDNSYSQGCGQIEAAFRALTRDDLPKPYMSDHHFRSTKEGNDVGYNWYIFHIKYRKNLESAQPIKVEFNILENIPVRKIGYALVSTNKLVSISLDGQRHFDLS